MISPGRRSSRRRASTGRTKSSIGVLGSHSALDVCDGAIDEGFQTTVVCQQGRDKTYSQYFRAASAMPRARSAGAWSTTSSCSRSSRSIMKPDVQRRLIDENVLFVPNRSFTSYCGMDAVENDFTVPMVGSRNLLRSEDRGSRRTTTGSWNRPASPTPRGSPIRGHRQPHHRQAAPREEEVGAGVLHRRLLRRVRRRSRSS